MQRERERELTDGIGFKLLSWLSNSLYNLDGMEPTKVGRREKLYIKGNIRLQVLI